MIMDLMIVYISDNGPYEYISLTLYIMIVYICDNGPYDRLYMWHCII